MLSFRPASKPAPTAAASDVVALTSTVSTLATTVGTKAAQSALDTLATAVGTKADDGAVVKTSGDQAISGAKSFSSGVRVDVAGDETGLHLAGNHDDTNHHGGKLRLTKFLANDSTGQYSSVIYQDGGTQDGDTVLVSGCRVSSPTRGFKFQAFKSLNFDDFINPGDVDTLGYIGRNGFNCTSGEYLKNGSQITYSDLAGTIDTVRIGDNQVSDPKIAAMSASKLTGTISTAQLGDTQVTNAKIAAMASTKLTGTIDAARLANAVGITGTQTVGGQKTYTGAQINTGGLYGLGTVSFQGTSSKAVTIQSANPGGGVNSELRLVTADNVDASNITYNTGTLKYNGATSTLEMDRSLSVTGAISSSVGFANTVTLNSDQAVGGCEDLHLQRHFHQRPGRLRRHDPGCGGRQRLCAYPRHVFD
jgi:hypothetical protein